MSKLSRVTLNEFKLLLAAAKESHLVRHEPIPELRSDQESHISKLSEFSFSDFWQR